MNIRTKYAYALSLDGGKTSLILLVLLYAVRMHHVKLNLNGMHRFHCSAPVFASTIQWKWRPWHRSMLCATFLIFSTRTKAVAQNSIYRIHYVYRVPTTKAFWRTSAAYSLITVLFLIVSSSDGAAVIYHIYYSYYYLHIFHSVSTAVRLFVLFRCGRADESDHKLRTCRHHHQLKPLRKLLNFIYCIYLTNLSLAQRSNLLYRHHVLISNPVCWLRKHIFAVDQYWEEKKVSSFVRFSLDCSVARYFSSHGIHFAMKSTSVAQLQSVYDSHKHFTSYQLTWQSIFFFHSDCEEFRHSVVACRITCTTSSNTTYQTWRNSPQLKRKRAVTMARIS